jgi:hypothetical protein
MGGICAKEHLSSDLGCLDSANRLQRTEKFIALSQKVAGLTKPNTSSQGLENRYKAFKTPAGNQGFYRQDEIS